MISSDRIGSDYFCPTCVYWNAYLWISFKLETRYDEYYLPNSNWQAIKVSNVLKYWNLIIMAHLFDNIWL